VDEDINVSDSAGNGIVEPGESAEIVVTLINYGEEDAQGVELTLLEEDDYVDVISGFSALGTIGSGDQGNNSTSPFEIRASSSTPHGHYARLNIRAAANAGAYDDTLEFWLHIGEPGGDYLVFDPDPDASSGPIIHQTLRSLGYDGLYTIDLSDLRGFLGNFSAVFVCLGVAPEDYMIPNGSADAESLVNYSVEHRGNLYMEGGNTWFTHPREGGHDFRSHFLITSWDDENSGLSAVDGLTGTFTEGMSFVYSGGNDSLDRIEPLPTAFTVLENTDNNFGCGVAYDGGNRRTLGLAFELGGLEDGGSSTKRELLRGIMQFFGLFSDFCGDANGDGVVTPSDAYMTLNYLGAGPAPYSCFVVNVNGDSILSPADGYHLLNYFGGGPPLDCHECVGMK
jgi:hypothetical protein